MLFKPSPKSGPWLNLLFFFLRIKLRLNLNPWTEEKIPINKAPLKKECERNLAAAISLPVCPHLLLEFLSLFLYPQIEEQSHPQKLVSTQRLITFLTHYFQDWALLLSLLLSLLRDLHPFVFFGLYCLRNLQKKEQRRTNFLVLLVIKVKLSLSLSLSLSQIY